jgi:hypothetical protein
MYLGFVAAPAFGCAVRHRPGAYLVKAGAGQGSFPAGASLGGLPIPTSEMLAFRH